MVLIGIAESSASFEAIELEETLTPIVSDFDAIGNIIVSGPGRYFDASSSATSMQKASL